MYFLTIISVFYIVFRDLGAPDGTQTELFDNEAVGRLMLGS
jgi:hypothetical protein